MIGRHAGRWLAAAGVTLTLAAAAEAEEPAASAPQQSAATTGEAAGKEAKAAGPTWQHGLSKPSIGSVETAAPPGTPEEAEQESRWQHGLSPVEPPAAKTKKKRKKTQKAQPAADHRPLKSVEHSHPVVTSDSNVPLSSEEESGEPETAEEADVPASAPTP